MTWYDELAEASRALTDDESPRAAAFLTRAASALRHDLIPSLEELDRSHVPVVHYTTMGTLYLILQAQIDHVDGRSEDNGYLRMYDPVHLRDPTEGSFLLDRLATRGYARTLLDENSEPGTYMLSLIRTAGGDSYRDEHRLMHWRAYGDDGSGCSIRFSCPVENLVPVVYGEEGAAAAAGDIDQVLSVCRDLPEDTSPTLRQDLDNALLELLAVRYCYKHRAYRHDQEARFTSLDLDSLDLPLKFDYRHPHIRHFLEHADLSAPKVFKSGTTITIGPSVPRQADVMHSIRLMLDRACLSEVSVEGSKIPYRSP